MKPLKVLFVIDSLGTGGAEYDLAERLPCLAALAIVPIVVALRSRSEGVQEALKRQGFDIRILPQRGLLRQAVALRRIIRSERPDLVRTVLFNADVAGRFAAAGTGTPVLSCLVNTDYAEVRRGDRNLSRIRFAVARRLDGWTARNLTTHIHANSEAVKTAAVRDLGLAPEKISVILHARDAARLGEPSAERRRRARLQLGLSEDRFVLVNVGRQDYQKGQCYLLEALGTLVRDHPDLLLLVAGRAGDVSSDLEQLARKLHLDRHIRFLGHRQDVPEILAAADLFVFPSLYEGLPGAVIEAMALGLPIVASGIDPVRELVEENRNALLVRSAVPDELARAIDRLVADRVLARAFGERSRAIFEERFTLEESMAREAALYRSIVANEAGDIYEGGARDHGVHPLPDTPVREPGTQDTSGGRSPVMSVILATPDRYETLRKTMRHLRRQTVRDQLELILVAPNARTLDPDLSDLTGFCRVRVVEAGPIVSIGSANARGIREAAAPLVALAEDHAFPAPDWAEALIKAHREPWAAVSPAIRNANRPQSRVAWADFLIGFGEWTAPDGAAVLERLPGNNGSYKRAALLELGADLERLMETETLLHQRLRRKGHQLYLDPAAQVFHLNFERLSSFFSVRFFSGRVYGAARAQGWSLPYRLFYACGTPLIPLVRYWRIRRHWQAVRRTFRLPRGVMPMIWCGLVASATAEMIGCCLGSGRAREKRAILEFHRVPHLVK